MGKKAYLDLDTVCLYGYQRSLSVLTIDAIIRGIAAGDDFPPFIVYRNGDGSYHISHYPLEPHNLGEDFVSIGGHNRAVAHYIAGKPIKVIVIRDPFLRKIHKIPIKDVLIIEDNGDYARRKEMYPNYR